MTILATRSLLDQAECGFHLIACTSNRLKRVCRSTLTAETYQMELGVEAADQLRAAIADMFEIVKEAVGDRGDKCDPISMGDGLSQQSQRTSPTDDGKADGQASGHHDCVSPTGNLEAQRRNYRCTDGD